MNAPETLQPGIERLGKTALVVGVAALVLCVAAGLRSPTEFFRSYLLAFVFWIGLPLGCCAILMLHHLVGGTWGFPLRRLLESGTKTLWLMAVLILPILFRLPALYSWADPTKVSVDPLLQYKHPYLNVPFFIARTMIYFATWMLLTYFLNKWSRQQDETGEPDLTRRLRRLSGPGLVVYGLTVTFASVDWVMSLEASWFSTIYGMIFMVTEALAAMALVTLTVILLSRQKSLAELISPGVLNDYGNLLLTFTMLWAYLSFSQYLIIWAGNLQEEIPWYVSRAQGGWAWVALGLIVFHFAVPFLLLLSRFVKRRAQILGWVAAGLVVMSVVDIYWLTVPAFERAGPEFRLTDWLAILGIGGLWLWRFAAQLKGRPLLPLRDPRLKEIMQHG
ncbi:MAG: hypothetical protein LAO04_05240 [Acidobacteriia bacterium]|nr:hypothetical protein [Terriglobia bacterium]